jgi:hypothetical protein
MFVGCWTKPNLSDVLRGTFVPTLHWNRDFLALMVAILGTTISPYMFFWQSDQEVEEQIAIGRTKLWQRQGATDAELKYAALDVNIGMLASNVVMYFIILSTGATLFKAGENQIQSATDAAAGAGDPAPNSTSCGNDSARKMPQSRLGPCLANPFEGTEPSASVLICGFCGYRGYLLAKTALKILEKV